DSAELAPLSRRALPAVLTLPELGHRRAADRRRAPALLPDRVPAPLQSGAGERGARRTLRLPAGSSRRARSPPVARQAPPGRGVRRGVFPPRRPPAWMACARHGPRVGGVRRRP